MKTGDLPVTFLFEQIRARATEPVVLERPLEIGELATPALVVEREAFEANVSKMARHLEAFGKGFRPHAKTHKCPTIAKYQLEAGAVGICVAKVSEAVALTGSGVTDVLITSPITVAAKVEVLRRLADEAPGLAVVVDSQAGIDLLKRTSPAHTVGVFVDLDVGMGRTGTRDDDLALRLIDQVQAAGHLEFQGFQHYAGHVMHIQGHDARARASLDLWHQVVDRLVGMGLDYDLLTGGGTGTYDIDTAVEEVTDLQVGSYIFMDEEYRQIGGRDGDRFEDFAVSLTVACTAISQPVHGAVTVDGGYKSMASDTVAPAVDELADTTYRFAGDEHGVLLGPGALQSVAIGDVVRVVSPHCDPTANLHDFYWVLESDGLVHSCWPITARGCTW